MAKQTKTDIYVFADWMGVSQPTLVGILSAQSAKGKKSFSFEYDKGWLVSDRVFLLDPDINFFSGKQYPNEKENFGIFLDSMPDTWGRTLMKRRAIQIAKDNGKPAPTLYDIDFLLGVFDATRIGGLRFKPILTANFWITTRMIPRHRGRLSENYNLQLPNLKVTKIKMKKNNWNFSSLQALH